MSNVLDDSEKVFSGSEFRDAWLLLLSKQRDPAASLKMFTTTAADGSERVNIGIGCFITGNTIFVGKSYANYTTAFTAIGKALDKKG